MSVVSGTIASFVHAHPSVQAACVVGVLHWRASGRSFSIFCGKER